jgi:hypothetical protein
MSITPLFDLSCIFCDTLYLRVQGMYKRRSSDPHHGCDGSQAVSRAVYSERALSNLGMNPTAAGRPRVMRGGVPPGASHP